MNRITKWIVNTFIEGILLYAPIFVFLSIIRNTEEHFAPIVTLMHPEYLQQMWFSETPAGLLGSMALFFFIVFIIFYRIKYKKFDFYGIISPCVIFGVIILVSKYMPISTIELYDYGEKIKYSVIPFSFLVYIFATIDVFWFILKYERDNILKILQFTNNNSTSGQSVK